MTRRFAFTANQERAATVLDRSMVVTAGAGSGKTRVLVERYLGLIDPTGPSGAKATPDSVVAITFTNKAAQEMLDRIRKGIRERQTKAKGDGQRRLWQDLYEQTARARVQTIHSFCSQLVRDYPVEARVDPEARVLEEFEARELFEEAARKAILGLVETEEVVRALVVEQRLSGLVAELSAIYRTVRASGKAWEEVEASTLLALAEEAGAPVESGLTPGQVARALFRLLLAVDREYAAAKAGAALDFEDLQLLARNLLRDCPEVLRRLRSSIRYLLVDEFQDTDALQHDLVTLLAGDPPGDRLFVVGDPKQSIYRFRHAEVELFSELKRWMADRAGEVVNLAENFRCQPALVSFANAVFAHLMGGAYESFAPGRKVGETFPAVELLVAEPDDGEKTEAATRREARLLAARLQAMVEGAEALVSEEGDDGEEAARPVRYGDVAILLRTRAKLKVFEAALAERGIPYVVVGGIGFYRKAEVRDLLCALRAVDDPDDALSLAAALRSPLVGLPDDALLLLAARGGGLGPGLGQVEALREDLAPETFAQLERAAALFGELRALRSRLPVAALLDLILERTGYEAALIGQPGGAQKVANVRKLRQVAEGLTRLRCGTLTDFLEYFTRLSEGSDEAEAPLSNEAGDAVKILTVHASKGLEFPVVAVADLSRKFRKDASRWRFDRQQGLGYCPPGPRGAKAAPLALHERLTSEARAADREELVRLLYVAVTRAKDHLLLTTSPEKKKGGAEEPVCWYDMLAAALAQVDLPAGLVAPWQPPLSEEPGTAATAAVASPAEPGDPPAGSPVAAVAPCPPGEEGAGGDELPAVLPLLAPVACPGRRVAVVTVSELMCFAACPRRYHLQYRLQTPPAPGWEGPGSEPEPAGDSDGDPRPVARLTAAERGTVLHQVFERLRAPEDCDRLLAEALDEQGVTGAAQARELADLRPLVETYLAGEEFAALRRDEVVEAEAPFYHRLAPDLLLRGVVDRLDRLPGGGLRLLDFKTNRCSAAGAARLAGEYYRLQLPLYAMAVEAAYGAPVRAAAFVFLVPDVRVGADLSPFAREQAREEARQLCRGIEAGRREPAPSAACGHCGYTALCEAGRKLVVPVE